jgi:alkylation response protein AidB-like acyl-CoA dehydrogenase
MDFELSADQQLLVETAASFVRKESPITRARKLREDALGFSRETWKRMGDMGWLGIPFSEEDGGFGGSFVDVALILEQLGTTLVPEPYLASVILAGGVLARAANAEQKAQFLAPMIAGDATLALAYAERDGRYDASIVGLRAELSSDGYSLTGEKIFVLNGHAADHLVVSARTGGTKADRDGISLFVVDPETPGVGVRPIHLFDGRRGAVVSFAGAKVEASRRLGAEGAGLAVLERVLDEGAAAACSEAVGLVRTVLFMTCDYLRTREQFGVKIGSFQALQHRAVDMFVESELLKSTAIMASIKVGEEDAVERQSALSAAKVQAAVSGRFVTQQSIQLFGGIGVTDEHDVGLYFKRLQVLLSLFGDEDHHLARYASLPSFTANLDAG